jgi:hypothetical protein
MFVRVTLKDHPGLKRLVNLDFVYAIEPHYESGSILNFASGTDTWELAVVETIDQIQALARPG